MEFDLDDDAVVVATDRQTTADLGTGVAVLNLDTKVYFTLEGTGQRIWQLLRREPMRVGELTRRLVETYDVEPERCRIEVMGFLRQLADRGLIESPRNGAVQL